MLIVKDVGSGDEFILIHKENFKKFLDAMNDSCDEIKDKIRTGYTPNLDIYKRKTDLMSAEIGVDAIKSGCEYIKRIYY